MKKLWYSTAYLTASLLLIIATLLLLPVTSQARYSASPRWLSTYTPTADAPAFSSDLLADVGEIYLLDWDVSQNNKKQLTFCICFPVEEISAEDEMPILYAEKKVTVDCAVSDNCVTAEATATDDSEVSFPADYIIPADGQKYLIKVNLTCEALQEKKEIAVTITAAYGEETLTGTVNITLLTGTETPFGSGYASQVSEGLLVMQKSYDPTQLICAALTLPNGCEKAELSTGSGIAFPAKTRFSFNGEDWRTLYEADTISVPLTSTYVQLDLSETALSAVPDAIRLRLDACIQGEEQEGTPLYLYQMAESAYVEWNALWQGSRVIRATSSRALLLPDNDMTVEGMVQMLMPLPEEEQSDSAEETEETDVPALVWTDVKSVKLEMKEISQPTQDPSMTPETISSLVVDAGEAAAGSYRLVITWKLGDTRVRTEYIPFFVVN